MCRFEQRLTEALEEGKHRKAAVAVVQDGKSWLLGLSTSNDDRFRTWCMPGGGVKANETIAAAAARECFEETGVRCTAVGKPFQLPKKPGVWFVHCRRERSSRDFKPNHEFNAVGFFTVREMGDLKLYSNVRRLVAECS